MGHSAAKILKLSNDCIFSDLNKLKGLDPNHVTSEIEIGTLKYAHIRQMQQMKMEDHMSFAMGALTGLSEKDLDELSSNDAAELMKIVYENLRKHFELTKDFLSSEFGQNVISNLARVQKDSRNL